MTAGSHKSKTKSYVIMAIVGALLAISIVWLDDTLDSGLSHGFLYYAFRTIITISSFFIGIVFLFVSSVLGLKGSEKIIPVLFYVVTGILGATFFCFIAFFWNQIRQKKDKTVH